MVVLQSGLDNRVAESELSPMAREQGRWMLHRPILKESAITYVMDLVFDAFDDVRSTAIAILRLLPDQLPSLNMWRSRGHDIMVATGRADYGDGFARASSLVHILSTQSRLTNFKILESIISEVELSIVTAKDEVNGGRPGKPIHGQFASLRYVHNSRSTSETGTLLTLVAF
jgi:hypothetical protein